MIKTNIILSIALIAIMFTAINSGIKKTDRAECVKWQGWQEQHKQFAPSQSMRDQCNYYQIKLK